MLMKGFIKRISVCGLDSCDVRCGLTTESYGHNSESSAPREDVEFFGQLKEFGLANGTVICEIILCVLLIVYCEKALVFCSFYLYSFCHISVFIGPEDFTANSLGLRQALGMVVINSKIGPSFARSTDVTSAGRNILLH
jgi:hypothetical protein